MQTASRTLVKSPPEVWEQLDHPGRMEGLMAALVGHATSVEIYERVEESKLGWKAGDEARIEVELAEKGWGTNVVVSAEHGAQATRLEGWLDAVLEELATPQKRPFESMGNPPPPPTTSKEFQPAPVADQQAAPVAVEQTAQVVEEQAAPEHHERERSGIVRRFLGL